MAAQSDVGTPPGPPPLPPLPAGWKSRFSVEHQAVIYYNTHTQEHLGSSRLKTPVRSATTSSTGAWLHSYAYAC